jgi:hypothetical protein
MKMTAIVQRATKRDYVDLHVLLESRTVTLADTVRAMQRKFPGVEPRVAQRPLVYFDDVDKQPMPPLRWIRA